MFGGDSWRPTNPCTRPAGTIRSCADNPQPAARRRLSGAAPTRTSPAPPSTVAPLIKSDLGITNTQLGLVFSAFAIPYAVFQLIGGWIGDRLGARLTLTLCCAIVALSTILTSTTSGVASLFAARLALGFGEGAGFPTATRAMASWTSRGRWGFAQGLVHSFARIGNAVTPPLMAGL